MKRVLFILGLLFVTNVCLFAQEDNEDDGNDNIRDKMSEFIQKRLDMTKEEAAKFTPVFIRYFKEWRTTLRENRNLPRLDLQQKIIDLRIKYRAQFRDIIGERRSNQVFGHQETFIKELQAIRRERLRNTPARPLKRNGG